MSLTGTVMRFSEDKGFGFISPDEGVGDIFMHIKSCNGAESLSAGDRVTYDNEWDEHKYKMQGTNCTVVGRGRVSKGGGKGAGKGSGTGSSPGNCIKTLASTAPKFKKAWVAYCKQYGEGTSDPSKCDTDFIAEFVGYVGDLVTADMGSPADNVVAPAKKAPKRSAAEAEAPPAKKKLSIKKTVADEIKRLNDAGGLLAPIKLAAVAAKLGTLGEEGAIAALGMLEEQQAEVENPNDFLNSAELADEDEDEEEA